MLYYLQPFLGVEGREGLTLANLLEARPSLNFHHFQPHISNKFIFHQQN